jgi:hypothetical protein
MTVRIAKQPVNIREKLSELERPIGLNGSALMRTETPQEAFSLIGAGRRNLIINGGFDVWQRGTTGSVVGGPAYVSADRWKIYVNTSTTITLSRQTFTSGQTEVPGNPTYYGRFSWLGTGSAQFFGIEELVEGVHHGAGDYLTISFYARTGNGENMSLGVNRNFGSGGSTGDTVGNYTLELETYWKKFVITIPVPSLSGKTIGSGNYMSITWYRSGTVSTYLDLSNVQVEYGKTATPFEHRSYGEELALCQRYFWKTFDGTTYTSGFLVNALTGNATRIPMPMTQVQMRATPSITVFSSAGTSGQLTEFSSVTTRNVSGIFPESTIGGGYAEVTSLGSQPVRFAAYYSAEL